MAHLDAGQLFLPFFGEFPARLITDCTYGWKPIAPLVRPHGFDDHARVVAFLARWNDRIEWPAPGAAQDIHRSRRIGARGHGPNDFVQIGDVDVFIDNDHVSPQVGAGVALASDQRGLFRVAGVSLFDRYDDHEALRRRRQVHSTNIRHASLLHAVPYHGGAQT